MPELLPRVSEGVAAACRACGAGATIAEEAVGNTCEVCGERTFYWHCPVCKKVTTAIPHMATKWQCLGCGGRLPIDQAQAATAKELELPPGYQDAYDDLGLDIGEELSSPDRRRVDGVMSVTSITSARSDTRK